jgi:hypothetical protein
MHQPQRYRYLIGFSYEKSAGRRYRQWVLLYKCRRKLYTIFSAMLCQQRKSDVMTSFGHSARSAIYSMHHMYLLGRFRTSTKLITITNTSSLCGYVRPNHDVIARHFVQTSSWRSKQTWFCWFASICGHFPLANAIPFDYLKKELMPCSLSLSCETSLLLHPVVT